MPVLKIEWLKLTQRKSSRVLFYIYLGLMVVLSGLYYYGEKQVGISLLNEGQFVTSSLNLVMAGLLPFVALYMSATSFALDFSQGTLKNMFLLPLKKYQVFIGKIGAMGLYMACLLGAHFIYTNVFSLLMDGGFALGQLFTSVLIFGGAWLALTLMVLLGAVLSLLLKSTGMVVLVTYLGFVALNFAGIYLSPIKNIALNRIVASYALLLTGQGFSQLLVLVAYCILLAISGSQVFNQKEAILCQYE